MDAQAAADQIDALIDKRAAGREAANAEEESWKAPIRRRRERIRKRNRAEWAAYYSGLAESHRELAERCEAKAALLEDDKEDERRA